MARPTRVRLIIREAGIGQVCEILIPYGDTWKHLQGAHDHSPGFEEPAFDDTLWAEAPASFGHLTTGHSSSSVAPCLQNEPFIETEWDVDTDLCIRKTITVPAHVNIVHFGWGIDNIADIYWDGVLVQHSSNEGCGTRGSHSLWFNNPTTGTVVIAVRGRDPGLDGLKIRNDTFLDLELTGCGPLPEGQELESGQTVVTQRVPSRVVAQIEDAKSIGVSKFHNSPGELFFTLQNSHEQIAKILPWETHWALEVFRGNGWTQLNDGWITDYDTADQETIFYGLDYIGVLSLLFDERFNPSQSPDRAALLYPDDAAGAGGSKYVEETIHDIVADQIDRAINSGNSEVSFFTRGDMDPMGETVTIFCTLKERLAFIAGLIDSHRAGTGKKTRLQSVATRTWLDAKHYTLDHEFRVLDDPGQDRLDLRMSYGDLIQGYRVIPFGEFATRVLGIGKTSTGFRLEFHIEPTPPPTGEDPNYNELTFGRLNRTNYWEDVIDLNDLRRRSRQLAGRVGAIGKSVGLGIRVDALGIEDGWDICDSVPVVIQRGPIDTTTMGGDGLWTIWGWAAMFQSNGYSETVLTLLPKEPAQALPDGWDTANVPIPADDFVAQPSDPDVNDPPSSGGIWINTVTGHIWIVDPVTGEWVDQTAAGTFGSLGGRIGPPGDDGEDAGDLWVYPPSATTGGGGSGSSEEVIFDHGAMGAAETLDLADGTVHRGTLDADCAITVEGFTVDEFGQMLVKLTQDGAGGWGTTWDADIVWSGSNQPSPTAGDVTWFILWSESGDATIYGAKIGGATDPADDTAVWMPLTTVVGVDPELVWDADDSLIPTLTPI